MMEGLDGPVLELAAVRRLRGLYVANAAEPRGLRRGLRVQAPVDELLEALRQLGRRPLLEPIENGIPDGVAFAAIRTLGVRWTDCVEPEGQEQLTEALAAALSQATGKMAFHYGYDFAAGAFAHVRFEGGAARERLGPGAVTAPSELDAALRAWGMRDWGFSAESLARAELAFPPQAVVEAGFVRLDTAHRSRFMAPLAQRRVSEGES